MFAVKYRLLVHDEFVRMSLYLRMLLNGCLKILMTTTTTMLVMFDHGRKDFYLTMHSPHFIYGYMASDYSDSERGKPLQPLHGLLFSISSKV